MIFDKERLFSTTPDFSVAETPVDNPNGTTQAIYYTGEPYMGKPTRNFAYMGFPSCAMPEGGYPAVIVCHGGGGCAFHEWVSYWNGKGYACIAPDLYGQKDGNLSLDGKGAPKNPDGGPSGSKPFETNKQNYKDKWLYHAVSDAILCGNILRSSDKVNPKKIAITGISWGSVVTMMTAGVDDRFCAYAPVYGGGYYYKSPFFGCDGAPPKDEKEWLENFDVVAYLPQVDKPILFTSGVDDPAFPATCNQKSWQLCGENATYSWRIELSHYHRWKDEDGMINVFKFIDKAVNGNAMPFEIVNDELKDGTLSVRVKNNSKTPIKATVHYTQGDHDEVVNANLKWDSINADGIDGVFTARIPNQAKMCFMQITDGQPCEFVLSTKIYFI